MTAPNTMPEATPAPFTYTNGIPTLSQLLPRTAGVPGVSYLQCSTANLRRAQDEGWLRIAGREQKVYTIIGPNGSIDCELYAMGEPIPGQSHTSGARNCDIDRNIYVATGITDPDDAPKMVAPKDPPKAGGTEQSTARPKAAGTSNTEAASPPKGAGTSSNEVAAKGSGALKPQVSAHTESAS